MDELLNNVSWSLSVGALWPVVRVRRIPGTKGSHLRPLGLVHWQASWPLSTWVVRMSVSAKKSPCQSRHLLQEGGPLPGPETVLLSNTRKWIVRGDTRADKARDFIGKGQQHTLGQAVFSLSSLLYLSQLFQYTSSTYNGSIMLLALKLNHCMCGANYLLLFESGIYLGSFNYGQEVLNHTI